MEQPIKLAATLYDFRDKAKFLLRDKYQETMAEWEAKISNAAESENCSPLQAAIKMAEAATDSDFIRLIIFAAFVEMTEPSNANNGYAS